jgi:hypothetical protein
MAITEIKIDTIEPFAEQQTFRRCRLLRASRASRKAVLQVRDLRLLRLPNSSRCGPNGCPYRSGEGIGPKGLFNQRKTFTYDLRSILAKAGEQ